MSPDPDRPTLLFEERQRFRQPWVLALIGLLDLGAWVALIWSLVAEDSELQVWAMAVIVAIFGVIFPLFLWLLELHTELDAAGLAVRFRNGAGGHRFALGDMASADAITYRPLRDFGGWGLRWGRHGSRAFNVSGDRGVQIIDVEGRRWVIGSQRSEELAAAIRSLGVPGGG